MTARALIRQYLQANNMTAQDLGVKLGRHKNYVSRYLLGQVVYGDAVLFACAKYFDSEELERLAESAKVARLKARRLCCVQAKRKRPVALLYQPENNVWGVCGQRGWG